jgi:hypothetical protein
MKLETRHFLLLAVAASFFPLLSPCPAQPAGAILDASELNCAIQYLHLNAAKDLRGGLACNPDQPEEDFFFIGEGWKKPIVDDMECHCDPDCDGLAGCEELAYCCDPYNNDTDGDCLGDGLEIELGLDPLSSDTDGNGTPDGDEDLNHDTIKESEEDFDGDGLANCLEVTVHTDPTSVDTDGDGFPDGAEVDALTGAIISDPCNPAKTPLLFVLTAPPVNAVLARSTDLTLEQLNTVVSIPPVVVVRSVDILDLGLGANTTISAPPTIVVLSTNPSEAEGEPNTTISSPPTTVVLSTNPSEAEGEPNTAISLPPVRTRQKIT